MSASQIRSEAYRQAGCIVMLAEFGVEIFGATLERTERRYPPAVTAENLFWGREEEPDRCDECFTRSLKEITVYLSGQLAQSRCDPEYKPSSEVVNYDEGWSLAFIQCDGGDNIFDLLDYLSVHAEKILDLRWRQVEAVAKALLAQSTLGGAEISAILDAVPPLRSANELGFDSRFVGRAFEQALIIRDGGLPQRTGLEPRCVYTRPSDKELATDHADGNDTVPAQQPNHAEDHVVTQPAAV